MDYVSFSQALTGITPLAVAAQRVDISGEGINGRMCSVSFKLNDGYIGYATVVWRETLWGCWFKLRWHTTCGRRSTCARRHSD